MAIESIRTACLDWYRSHRRTLPWREDREPYRVLVSEIMLQQTQVQTVIPYFRRFIDRFPTVEALAQADEADVLKHWEGLGYYRRARMLQKAARSIMDRYAGAFPQTRDELAKLPGIGPYTSAAMASICFGQAVACVDGNVIRVVSRLYALDDDMGRPSGKRRVQQHADRLIDPQHPGDFNQAMMELGATICRPKQPKCEDCPIAPRCQTRIGGDDPHQRPLITKRTRPRPIDYRTLIIIADGRILIGRRREDGLLGGLWEFPTQLSAEFRPWSACFKGQITKIDSVQAPISHQYTHIKARYFLELYRGSHEVEWTTAPKAYCRWRWVSRKQLDHLALTKVSHKILPLVDRTVPRSVS